MKKEKVSIIGQDHFGRGIAKIDGKTIFVINALPEEEVTIEVLQDKKNYSVARNMDYVNRTKCPYYDLCGGCNILHQSYEEQLKFKENKVRELVKKVLKSDIQVNPIVYGKECGYRNKAVFHIKNQKLGFFSSKTNDLVEIENCLLVDNKINLVLKEISNFLKENKVNDNEVLIRITKDKTMVSFKNLISSSIIHSLSANFIVIAGKVVKEDGEFLTTICGIKFKVSDTSFFQVNQYVTEKLYEEVIKHFRNEHYKNVLDLYCGTGTITLSLSKYVDKITGIEVVESAVEDANSNKERNHISNANFISGRVEDYIEEFKNMDAIVVDPPRSGLDKKTINHILKIQPESIFYVSCDVNTLMRDLSILKDNYIVQSITPVDMFPNTYHVETIAVLNLK